jgi:cytochrome c oxidase cbb3-type subunit 2
MRETGYGSNLSFLVLNPFQRPAGVFGNQWLGIKGGEHWPVAEDFLLDNPVQLGSLNIGPDLANTGARADANWQLVHLYTPQSVVKDSTLPPFRYLFEVRKIRSEPSPDALKLPAEFAPTAGYEVVPKPEAKELAAYLLSLRANVPLYSAPFTP